MLMLCYTVLCKVFHPFPFSEGHEPTTSNAVAAIGMQINLAASNSVPGALMRTEHHLHWLKCMHHSFKPRKYSAATVCSWVKLLSKCWLWTFAKMVELCKSVCMNMNPTQLSENVARMFKYWWTSWYQGEMVWNLAKKRQKFAMFPENKFEQFISLKTGLRFAEISINCPLIEIYCKT